MSNTLLYALTYIVFLALMVVISWVAGRKSTSEEVYRSQNNFGSIVIVVISIGAFVSATGLVGISGWTYAGGLGPWMGYALSSLLAVLFMIFFMPRIKVLNMNTPTLFIKERYPKYNGIITYPVGFMWWFQNAAYLGVQFNALALLCNIFFGWSHMLSLIVTTLFVLGYSVIAGLVSMKATAMIQSIIQIATPILILIVLLCKADGWSNVVAFHENNGTKEYLSWFKHVDWYNDIFYYTITLGLFFIFIGYVSDWQRICAAKSSKVALRGMGWGIVAVVILTGLAGYIGIIAPAVIGSDAPSGSVFYIIMKDYLPVGLTMFCIVGIMSTILSGAIVFVNGGSVSVSENLIIEWLKRGGKEVSDQDHARYYRIGTVLTVLFAFLLSWLVPSVMDLFSLLVVLLAVTLVIPYIFAWFSKKMNTEGALLGMFSGGIGALIWRSAGSPFEIDYMWVGYGLSLLGCIVGMLAGKKPDLEVVNRTYYFSPRFHRLKK